MQGKMEELVVETLNKMFKVNSEYYNASMEMKRLAHAYREAFSDLNTVNLFGLDVTEYLELSYKLEIERRLSPATEGILRELQTEPNYLSSFETRLGMVLDQMFGFPFDKNKVDRYFIERKNNSYDNKFFDFLSYVEKMYNKFIHKDKINRYYYRNFFIEINTFWGKSISEKILKKRSEFRKIIGCGNTLEKSLSVVDIFSNKSVTFKKNSATDNGKKICYTFIAEERDVSYGEVQVENLGQFFEYAYRVSEEMIKYSGEESQPCWYRGMCNRNYSLLPSLYRLYDNKKKEQVRHSIYAYQTKILQDAYYLTMKMSGLWTEQLHGIAEHTCCLQHYGMPTTLLDFSLDMLVALYFALNPDREEDRIKIDIGKSTPKVVIFNLVLYYKAMWSLKAGKVIEDEPYARCSPVMFDSGDSEMEDYFVYDMSAKKSLDSEKRFFEKLYVPNPRINLYPKPVIIQQTNSRVLSQNGIFMAYNLNTVPDNWGRPFRYLDLKTIQNEYMELFKNEKKKKEAFFLREIIIDSFAANMIRKQLNMIGLNKSKMYPELSEIFKRILTNILILSDISIVMPEKGRI